MHAFVRVPGGFAARLEPGERTVLARVVADTAELLGTVLDEVPGDDAEPAGTQPYEHPVLAALDFEPGGDDAGRQVPDDPAVARLLPPMSHDDPGLSAELRALTEDGLRAGKVARLRTVWEALSAPGSAVVVASGGEGVWLAALTDVRLVLAVRLGIDDEADAEAVYDRAGTPTDDDGDDVTDAMATLYAALTWWQESLLEAMSRRGGRR